jgi:hypothetical protein
LNAKFFVPVCVLLSLATAKFASSAPFGNLDFEEAVVPGDALPNWSVNNLGPIYDLFCLGSSCVSVHDTGSPAPLEGGFSLFLQGGTSGDSGDLPLIGASISQTGDVPGTAKSIRMLSTTGDVSTGPITSFENLRASLNGTDIPLIPLGTVGDIITVGGNIAAFAGTTAALTIATTTPEMDGPELWVWLDAVSFSSVPVPEPSGLVISALGTVILLLTARRRTMMRRSSNVTQ